MSDNEIDYAVYTKEALSGNMLAATIGEQLVSFANTLGELSLITNVKSDGPKRPTIGVILSEAKESDNPEVQAALAEWNEIREASKAAYRNITVMLHPEFADLADDDDSDDAEKSAAIAQAREINTKIKAGLAFLATQDNVPADFANTFLGSIPVVEGARQRTSISDGSTLRPRFSTLMISGPDNFQANPNTFTDAVKELKGKLDVDTSDLSAAWQAAGGNAETESGTRIEFSIDEFEFVTVKK